ncbi:orotidine-5'-phosphate decarboxylase [Bartonella australis AUST/NH1]|uniref:Orotidine-5'-phosphate decarboxylase n=1 Tax=Bartonella australis (strain Aust/NH1) TaxID=1094489 RepID=M1NXG3_BARAA|nr:orotidine-5'-phosphate decarboxylase [Bartonella australis]AGF74162.1 orotidine-5'-phosphate decarboxylase [Bartonella australis AUST/NH1]
MTFIKRFYDIRNIYGPLCIGFDPSHDVLKSWSLPVDADGLGKYCDTMLEAVHGQAGIIKPQVAFFESYGPEGMYILHDLILKAHNLNFIVIADAKRGDIGSTAKAYGEAWVSSINGFGVDALTVNAFLGFDALIPLIHVAEAWGKGVFVVVQSSNPEGEIIQSANIKGKTLAEHLAHSIYQYNSISSVIDTEVGLVGAVIGGTLGDKSKKTIEYLKNSLFLVPGIGAQGGDMASLKYQFDKESLQRIIPTISRAISCTGPDIYVLKQTISGFAKQAKALIQL